MSSTGGLHAPRRSACRPIGSCFGRRFQRRIWKRFGIPRTRDGQWATIDSGRRSNACPVGGQRLFPKVVLLKIKWSLTLFMYVLLLLIDIGQASPYCSFKRPA